jgi:hypothetical protein
MSIKSCLDEAVAQREITRFAADELDLLYNRFVEQHAKIHGPAEAQRRARDEIAKRMETSALQQRRVALLQAAGMERTHDAVMGYTGSRGVADPARGLIELLETHGRRDDGLATGSVDGKRKAIVAAAHAELEELLAAFQKGVAGGRLNRAQLDNVVRELFGEGTGDAAAKAFADSWGKVAEGLRQRYNENGGAIGKLEKWGLPQSHNETALRRVGFDDWAARIMPSLDWDKMRHALSGDPILPSERQEVLRNVWETITTQGAASRLPTPGSRGRGALYKQHADHRFLVFKDADSWLAYSRDFGEGDPFAAMMGYINVMARDIAAMEILGPNPETTLGWIKNLIQDEALKAGAGLPSRVPRQPGALARDPASRARSAINRAEAMWDLYRGATDVAVNNEAAATMTTLRGLTTAGSLGSAQLSALSDPGFGGFARAFVAGGSVAGGAVQQMGAVLDGLRGMTRAEAVRAGLILDTASNAFGQRAREANLVSGPVLSRALADTVLRVQGLQAWTQAGKHGFGLWLMGMVGDQVSRRFGDLDEGVRGLLRRYGLSETDWDLIGLARLHDLSPDGAGATILRPREIAGMGVDDLGRLLARDRKDGLAARQALATFEGQLYKVADDVRDDLRNVIAAANANGATVSQIQSMLGTALGRVPAKLRDQLSSPLWTRDSLLATIRDIAEGQYTRTEMARLRWRESAEFQALPEWMRNLFGDPETSLGDVRDILRAVIDREPRDSVSGPPSIPSDRAADKVRRYFRTLSERYNEMIIQETAYAVPEATLRTRSILLGQTRPGTLQGEAARAFTQFKSFGVAVLLLHGGRIFNEVAQGRAATGVGYAAAGLATLTVLGMASLQLKQTAKGEDPRDMSDWRNWGAAMVQSGGFGIYGDFFLADQNRLGGGLVQTIVGPVPGRAADILKATIGNVQETSEGKKTNVGREVLKNVKSFDPLASLWFTRLAWDRLAYSELQRALDPEASVAFRRQIDAARRNRQTEFWWRPGETAPDRAPNPGAAIGAR